MPIGAYCSCGRYKIDEECPCCEFDEPMIFCSRCKRFFLEDDVYCPFCAERDIEEYERRR